MVGNQGNEIVQGLRWLLIRRPKGATDELMALPVVFRGHVREETVTLCDPTRVYASATAERSRLQSEDNPANPWIIHHFPFARSAWPEQHLSHQVYSELKPNLAFVKVCCYFSPTRYLPILSA